MTNPLESTDMTDPKTDAPSHTQVEALSEVDELKAQLAAAEQKASENWDKFLRATAELENLRRRGEREMAHFQKYALERVFGELLALGDSLDMGLQAAEAPGADLKSVAEGVRLKHRQFFGILEKFGVQVIDPQGKQFNSDEHEAVSMLPSPEVPPNHVLSVMQKGYKLHDRVLRPARVVVARAPENTDKNPH